jgi:hypothetical protein
LITHEDGVEAIFRQLLLSFKNFLLSQQTHKKVAASTTTTTEGEKLQRMLSRNYKNKNFIFPPFSSTLSLHRYASFAG